MTVDAPRREDAGPGPSSTRPRRRPSRRNEILRRTAHLFLERGYETTSLLDVAGACGISKAGLYYHFRSKQELLAAIINYAHDILEQEIQNEVADSRSDEEALRRLIHTHALIITREDDAAFAILAVDEMRSLLPADRERIARRKRAYLGLIRERLERLAAAGKLCDVDITTATHTLAGMVLWLPKWYRQPGRLSAGRMANEITKLAMNAVLAESDCRTEPGLFTRYLLLRRFAACDQTGKRAAGGRPPPSSTPSATAVSRFLRQVVGRRSARHLDPLCSSPSSTYCQVRLRCLAAQMSKPAHTSAPSRRNHMKSPG